MSFIGKLFGTKKRNKTKKSIKDKHKIDDEFENIGVLKK